MEGLNVFWDDASRQVVYQVKSEEFRTNGEILREPCIYDEEGYCEECGRSGTSSHQVIDYDGNLVWDKSEKLQEWWSSPDLNILESIAHFLRTPSSNIRFTNIFLHERLRERKPADNELEVSIHTSDWSDFACEKMYLEFTVRADGCFVFPYKLEMCDCVVPNPEVGDFLRCLMCGGLAALDDRDRTLCCKTKLTYGEAVEKAKCTTCLKHVRLECPCVNPTLRRSETVCDDRYANPTCGKCFRYVKSDVLEKFEEEVAEFVNATHGRL